MRKHFAPAMAPICRVRRFDLQDTQGVALLMYALDTNTVIHYFKDAGGVTARLNKLRPSDIVIPISVFYER